MNGLCVHSIATHGTIDSMSSGSKADSGERIDGCASERRTRWRNPPCESSSFLRHDKLGVFHL